jgi:hypothetical protein
LEGKKDSLLSPEGLFPPVGIVCWHNRRGFCALPRNYAVQNAGLKSVSRNAEESRRSFD